MLIFLFKVISARCAVLGCCCAGLPLGRAELGWAVARCTRVASVQICPVHSLLSPRASQALGLATPDHGYFGVSGKELLPSGFFWPGLRV